MIQPTVEIPRCPLHLRPMREIPQKQRRTRFSQKRLPALDVRFRCPVDGCFQVQLVVLREKYQAPQVILPLWVTHPRPKYRGTYDPYNGGHHHTKGGPKRSPSKATRQRIGAASRLVWERAGYREMQSKAHRKEEKS